MTPTRASSPRNRRCPPLVLLLAAGVAASATFRPAEAGQGIHESVPLRPKDALLIEKSREMEELFHRRGHVLQSGPEVELVRRVGRSVLPPNPVDPYVDFRFGVIRNPVPNAFALPDGQIWVHSGLLALLENEAQLAAVLAHESMHVEGHHSIVHARQARKKQGGMVALSVLLGDIGSLINIALQHAIIGYGRDLEEEADRLAVPRLLSSGYDPREMPRVFELLDLDPEGDRPPVRPAWSNHPLAVARAAYTRRMLADMEETIEREERRRGSLRVGEEDFGDAVQWSAHDAIRQHVVADRPRTALLLAERAVARWPENATSHALLGEAWRALDARTPHPAEDELTKKARKRKRRSYYEMTRQEREELRLESEGTERVLRENREQAELAYLEALQRNPEHPEALRGLGTLYEEAGLHEQAGHRYAAYVRAAPEAADRALVLERLEAITHGLRGGRR